LLSEGVIVIIWAERLSSLAECVPVAGAWSDCRVYRRRSGLIFDDNVYGMTEKRRQFGQVESIGFNFFANTNSVHNGSFSDFSWQKTIDIADRRHGTSRTTRNPCPSYREPGCIAYRRAAR